MSTWYVWGDYVHTRPERIGEASLVEDGTAAARDAAESNGFFFDRRVRNGFEPWVATFRSDKDDANQEFAFAAYPTVRGYRKI